MVPINWLSNGPKLFNFERPYCLGWFSICVKPLRSLVYDLLIIIQHALACYIFPHITRFFLLILVCIQHSLTDFLICCSIYYLRFFRRVQLLKGQVKHHQHSFGSVHSTYRCEFPWTLLICLAFFNDNILASVKVRWP